MKTFYEFDERETNIIRNLQVGESYYITPFCSVARNLEKFYDIVHPLSSYRFPAKKLTKDIKCLKIKL